MKRLIVICSIFLLFIIFASSCGAGSVPSHEYESVLSNLHAMTSKYNNLLQENNTIKSNLTETSNKTQSLQSQLSKANETISSQKTEIEGYKSLPQHTSVYVANGILTNVITPRGNTSRVDLLNGFVRIQGKISGSGFQAYLKRQDGSLVSSLSNQFDITPTGPFNQGYYIDFKITDGTDNKPYSVAWVEFY